MMILNIGFKRNFINAKKLSFSFFDMFIVLQQETSMTQFCNSEKFLERYMSLYHRGNYFRHQI